MNLAINGSLNWWRLAAFEKALGGPKIAFFDEKSYGSGLDLLLIELFLHENGPKRDFTVYRDSLVAQFSIAIGPDFIASEEGVAFGAIASRMYDGLQKGFKRKKIPNFDYVAFLNDLKIYVSEKTKTAEQYGGGNGG
jgi:hypothetical protein